MTLLAACAIPLTPAAHDPYPPALVESLRQADRAAVRRALGEPAVSRAGGEFWFYAQPRWVPRPIGAWDGTFVERWEWLAVMFEPRGTVLFAEASELERGCLSNGICNRSGGQALRRAPESAVLTAPLHQDAAAKAYRVRAGECALYFYADGPATLSIGRRVHGTADEATYLFATHAAGTIELSTETAWLATDCRSGEALHVREGALVARDAAEAALAARRLALSR